MNIFLKWLGLQMTVFKSSSFSVLNNAHQLLSNIIRATLFPRLKWTFINIKIKNYEMLIDQADVVLCLLWIFFTQIRTSRTCTIAVDWWTSSKNLKGARCMQFIFGVCFQQMLGTMLTAVYQSLKKWVFIAPHFCWYYKVFMRKSTRKNYPAPGNGDIIK